MQEPAGRRVTLTYNTDGKVQTIEDWGNRGYVVLTYEGSDLTEVWQQEGAVSRYGYDGIHRITSIVDPEGYETTYSFDSAGRVYTRSVAGNLGRYTYVTSGSTLETGYTDPLGNTWTYLTSGGNPTGRIDRLGHRQTYVYANNLPQGFTNELGYTVTFSFDSNTGYRTGTEDPLARIIHRVPKSLAV